MVGGTVPPRSDAVQIAALLDSPEIGGLIGELGATRWTGRPGYPIPTMIGMALVKSLYTLPTWTRTVALVASTPPSVLPRLRRPCRRAERACLLQVHSQAAGA
jgi:hypothetical protein